MVPVRKEALILKILLCHFVGVSYRWVVSSRAVLSVVYLIEVVLLGATLTSHWFTRQPLI